MDGALVAITTLGEAIAAYKARIAELEALVQRQQQQLNALEAKSNEVG